MTKRLIVNADDFGRTPGVTEGILRAHREGIVTSTTALMNMPGAASGLMRAKEDCPRLGLGVHLVFTSGRPLLPGEWVGSLVDAHGYFLSQEAILADPERLDLGELKSELKAQIKTFHNAVGRPPDHLDAHHFVHILPRFFEVYLELVKEAGVPTRLPFPRNEKELAQSSLELGMPPDQLRAIIRADWALLEKYPARSTDHYIMSFFGEEAVTLTHLLHILDGLNDGSTELMTHPGLADEMLRQQSSYNVQREKELGLLCHPTIKQHIADLGVQLITFANL